MLHIDVPDRIGDQMYGLLEQLYPICRSITGNGVRQTLDIINDYVSVEMLEIPSETKVFDWTVPKEWNIKDAYIADSNGKRVVDFRESNLHVLGYSRPIHEYMSKQKLAEHVHTLPEHPQWIPFRTTFYEESWGFCLSQDQWESLRDDVYEIRIDSQLKNGALTLGVCYIPGEVDEEVLISTHVCHPSLCNDNLSGIVLSVFLAQELLRKQLRYSYRFVLIPATIGSITWLAMNEEVVPKIKHGLVASNVGDSGPFTYKRSRQGKAEIDRIVEHVLTTRGPDHRIIDFFPYGYDERQYCSPGFNLPVGSLTRSPNGQYPQYHSSGDNLDFVHPQYLAESFAVYASVIEVLENNRTYINTNPKCEPQLGKRGLYNSLGGSDRKRDRQMCMLWILNMSDGHHSLLDISQMSGMPFDLVKEVAELLCQYQLLEEAKP